MNALESAGVYTPQSRLPASELREALTSVSARGVDSKAVADADEDAVTMAHAAASDALESSAYDRDDLSLFAVATTTPPLAEGDIASTVAELLGLPRETDVVAHTQSTRDGVRALLDAARADGPALAVAADSPFGDPTEGIDHAAGAGAVAFVTGPDGDAELADSATYAEDRPGVRYRTRGTENVETYGATEYERDAYRTALSEAVSEFGEVDALAPTAPDASLPYRGARAVDGSPDVYERANDLGDTGTAGPLFGLLAAWDAGESDVAVVGYAGGSADAVRVSGALSVPAERETVEIGYPAYARKRGHIGGDA